MKNLVFSLLIILCFQAHGQENKIDSTEWNNEIYEIASKVTKEGYVFFKPDIAIQKDQVFIKHKSKFGLGKEDELKSTKSFVGELGHVHQRYQQYYKNILVEGGEYIIHSNENGIAEKANGILIRKLNKQINPLISEGEALKSALAYLNAEKYSWEDAGYEQQVKEDTDNKEATSFPEAKLVLTRKPGENNYKNEDYILTYKFQIRMLEPFDHKAIYVDAQNGKVIKELALMRYDQGTFTSLYNGARTIETTKRGFPYYDYFLFGTGFGHYTKVYNPTYSWGLTSRVTDGDNIWGTSHQAATSAHWATEMSYKYFKFAFNRNGIRNGTIGTEIRVLAGWDKENAAYSNDNGIDYLFIGSRSGLSLAALDIVGHEYTHGITEQTAGLEYRGESGALDESFSDIFGVMVERHAGGTNAGLDWLLGEDVETERSMQNPQNFWQPDTYGGFFWINTNGCIPTDDNDYCGVHTNGGVQNYWFYLVAQGGTHNGRTITGIGIDNAARIAYRMLTVYLTSTSNYQSARAAAIQSAEDIFGACSNTVRQVTNAWASVGVGAAFINCTPPVSVYISGNSSLNTYQTGNWTANASGGNGTYSYRWFMKTSAHTTWQGPYGTSRTYSQRMYPQDRYIELRVEVTSGTMVASSTTYVSCNDCTSSMSATAYPNPADQQLTVDLEEAEPDVPEVISYSLYNENGEKVYQTFTSQPTVEINTNPFPSGMYYLEMIHKEGVLRKKIFIKHE